MKVLFAVSNESISESIVKKYQKEYKEIISYKNVYYFNAILKEIERDKSYDRIVISEDLEPFANNNYETIDRFLFEKLDGISDEASNGEGADIPIILICTDRRAKSDAILLKLFSIGVYNAIIGQDRSIDEVCNLINKPRTKKDAKIYYKVDADDASYQSEDEDSVSEAEIQNILAHYKRLGKNTDRYVDSFNNIAAQYTDQQLKIIIKFLPLNVKAILEAESPRYQEVNSFENGKKKKATKTQVRVKPAAGGAKKKVPKVEDIKIDLLEDKEDIFEPKSKVVIPTGINTNNVKRPRIKQRENIDLDELGTLNENTQSLDSDLIDEEPLAEPVKRGRGRPKKTTQTENTGEDKAKKTRGRPKKVKNEDDLIIENDRDIDLDDILDDEEELNEPIKEIKPIDLFDLSEDENDSSDNNEYEELDNSIYEEPKARQIANNTRTYENVNIENLITKDKKIVAFVGDHKNGTSFLINTLASQFSSMGINTAILDATKNKNSYYIYTKNEEALRKKAFDCIDKLKNGTADGVVSNKCLTVYTSLPGVDKEQDSIGSILATLVRNHSLILIDCDFETDIQYFANAQEIYLVQSMDILTIQPLTAFLRDLKTKNVLQQEKLRIVINKEVKIKGLTPKVLIGGMAFYNEPAMTFTTSLFDRENVKYCTIPYEVGNYEKYLEQLINCDISINSYSKTFVANIKALANLVYPLLSRQTYQNNNLNNYGTEAKNTKVKKIFKFGK